MASHHLVRTTDQKAFEVPSAFVALSKALRRWSIVNCENGSVHQEFNICELAPLRVNAIQPAFVGDSPYSCLGTVA